MRKHTTNVIISVKNKNIYFQAHLNSPTAILIRQKYIRENIFVLILTLKYKKFQQLMLCPPKYSMINFLCGIEQAPHFISSKGNMLWSIIYVTHPGKCWLYLFYRNTLLFFLFASYILWCIYQCRQCPITGNCHWAVCQWRGEKGDSLDIPPIIPLENWYCPSQ